MEIDWTTITISCLVVILVMIMAYELRKPKVLRGISSKMLLDRLEESQDVLIRAKQTKCFQCGEQMRVLNADLYDENIVLLGCQPCGIRVQWTREEVKRGKPRWILKVLTKEFVETPAPTPKPTPPPASAPPSPATGLRVVEVTPPSEVPVSAGNTARSASSIPAPPLKVASKGSNIKPVAVPRSWLVFNLLIFGVICGALWFLFWNLYAYTWTLGIIMSVEVYRNYIFIAIAVIAVIYLKLLHGKWRQLSRVKEKEEEE